MIFRSKSVIFLVLLPLLLLSSSYQSIGLSSDINLKVNSNQKSTAVSGNVSIVIFNYEYFYSSQQIDQVNQTINSNLKSNYPSVNFNLTVVTDTDLNQTSFSDLLLKIIELNNANYVIVIGAMDNNQKDYFSLLNDWAIGNNNTNIEHFGLINYMRKTSDLTRNYISTYNNAVKNNVSFADYNLLQAGFMSGVKASLLTKTDKIGLILDHTLEVTFNNPLNSPLDSNGYSIYSLNRADFVTGFIAGVEYSSEYLLNRTTIDITTEGYDYSNPDPISIMNNNVQKLSDLGVDTIFNMETFLDDQFIQKANSLSIKTGVLGPNNTNADFSFVENNGVLVQEMINQWNNSIQNNEMLFNLGNSTAMSLSQVNDNRLTIIQTLILNGTIIIPSAFQNSGVPGFEFLTMFSFGILIILRKKSKTI